MNNINVEVMPSCEPKTNLDKCNLCPHRCNIDRRSGQIGRCKATNKVKIALVSLHKFEEPCISGKNGSGTVFFSNCNLKCKFCQNYKISQLGNGTEITVEDLAKIFINQQERGAHNINLVTPTMYAYQITQAIKIARKNGLILPIVYNTNGYENVETIELLDGYIDVYLPDFKYFNNELAIKYSGVDNYFECASKAIAKMKKQVVKNVFDKNGMIQKGLIIRHLILPNYIQNTKNILKFIKDNIGQDTYVSVMAQYFPTYLALQDNKINRKLTKKEYKQVEDYLYCLGLNNGYIQELGEHEEEYVPNFAFDSRNNN